MPNLEHTCDKQLIKARPVQLRDWESASWSMRGVYAFAT